MRAIFGAAGGAAACLAAVLTVTSCSSSGGSGGSGASGDVSIGSCTKDASTNRAVVTGQVHNRSSKKSSYVVTVEAKANGSRIETGFATVLSVDSGATKSYTVRAAGPDIPTGTSLTCSVTRVARTATP